MKPFFSIIVPVYNVEAYLNRCLESVCHQDFDDYEIICVNDGSTDNCGKILDQYAANDSRIIVIHQRNGGLSAARNVGTTKASGEWLLYVDSDDHINRHSLSILYSYIRNYTGQNPLDMICFGGSRGFCTEEVTKEVDVLSGWDYFQKYSPVEARIPFMGVVQRLYRKKYLIENNITFKEGIYHEDVLFTPIACYYAKNVLVVPDILYYVETREGSITTTRGLKHYLDTITCANELADFFIPKTGIEKDVIYQRITYYYKIEFTNCTRLESSKLRQMINWCNLKKVSKTNLRNRIQYLILCINPMMINTYKRLLHLIHP